MLAVKLPSVTVNSLGFEERRRRAFVLISVVSGNRSRTQAYSLRRPLELSWESLRASSLQVDYGNDETALVELWRVHAE